MKDFIKRLLLGIIMTIILVCLIIGGKQTIANAEEFQNLNWQFPTSGKITDVYGSRNGEHKGIDIADSVGTPIHSVDEGIVSKSYYSSSYGHVVFIKHPSGFETVYAHLQSRKAIPGKHVKRGEIIGYMGNTGKSSGPHLHFEIHKNEWTLSKQNSFDPFIIFGNAEVGQYVNAGKQKFTASVEVTAKPEQQSSQYHIVQSGETLWDIATKHNMPVELIKELNELTNEVIVPGQQLLIQK